MSRIQLTVPTPPEVVGAMEEKVQGAFIPRHSVAYTAVEAKRVGACPEGALSEQDVLDSADDLNNAVI